MPQQSLLDEHPAMTSFRILVRSFPHTKYPDEVQVLVQVGVRSGPLKTRWAHTFRGLECDYLNTLATEAMTTYMYGECARDVASACQGVAKMAKAHAAAHEF